MVFVIHRINGLDGLSNVYVLLQQFGGWFGDLVASSRAVVPLVTLGGLCWEDNGWENFSLKHKLNLMN